MAQTHRHTDKHTDGHGDSMTDAAQRAESVKILNCDGQKEAKTFPLIKTTNY